jgi:hypothetical protein
MNKNYLIFGIVFLLCFGLVNAVLLHEVTNLSSSSAASQSDGVRDVIIPDIDIVLTGIEMPAFCLYADPGTGVPIQIKDLTHNIIIDDTTWFDCDTDNKSGRIFIPFNVSLNKSVTYYFTPSQIRPSTNLLIGTDFYYYNTFTNIDSWYSYSGSFGPSVSRAMKFYGNIVIVESPLYDNQTFNNKTTTDLTTVPDIAAVENFTVASSTSAVRWTETVDLSTVSNITSVILTTSSFISVDVTTVPSLDTPAFVSLTPPSSDCNDFILYYANGFYTSNSEVVANGQIVATKNNIGGDCTDASICTNVQCTNGVLTFEAQHFDGFGIGLGNIDAVDSCKSTQGSIFAAFGLIALFIIVGAAFLVINLTKGEFDGTSIIVAIVGFIAVAIVIFVGYLIISQVSAGICVI